MTSIISLGACLEDDGIYICPISKTLMSDPVQLNPCNHVVSRKAFEMLHVDNCPVCNKKIMGYGRSVELEYKVDIFVRKKMKLYEETPFPADFVGSLDYLTKIYGVGVGITIFAARNRPYRFINETRQSRVLYNIRILLSRIFIFFLFTGISTTMVYYL